MRDRLAEKREYFLVNRKKFKLDFYDDDPSWLTK